MIWEDNSPDSLVDICTRYCIANPHNFCFYNSKSCTYHLQDGITLPLEICESFIHSQTEINQVIDDKFLSIFHNPSNTRLRRLNLRNCPITDDSLKFILQHNLIELDVTNCINLTEDITNSINYYCKDLLILLVGNSRQIFPQLRCETDEPCDDFLRILNLPNLRVFSLTDVQLKSDIFYRYLFTPLRKLSYLDLSGCQGLGTLECILHLSGLQSLILFDVPDIVKAFENICKLKDLRLLDISQSDDRNVSYTNPDACLNDLVVSHPNLTSLDISGTNLGGDTFPDEFDENKSNEGIKLTGGFLTDIPGLRNRTHPLEFLGLYNTYNEACRRTNIPALRISGDGNETQILTAAQVYLDRPEMLQRALNDLFHIFRYEICHQQKVSLEVILAAMRRHVSNKHIQISGSASLFYIVKGDDKQYFNIKIKRKIIGTLLNSMEQHKLERTMMRNSCLTLCQFRIPQDVLFDYKRLVVILLEVVALVDQEEFVQRIGIYLLNSLACQVDGEQKKIVGNAGAITTMLKLIEDRLTKNLCDDIMEIAWSTMWNVTDETPINCERFLNNKGMDYFLGCLKTFQKAELLRNMMGLLGNVAEVKYLRCRMMTEEYITVFSDLLDSTSDGIEVSYNAAGVLSHILSDGPLVWIINEPSRDKVLRRMESAIDRWEISAKRNINYRSFEPILRLINHYHTPQCQYWAVWALANLTHVSAEKYCPLIQEEHGIELLQSLIEHPKPNDKIKKLAQMVLDQCYSFAVNGATVEPESRMPSE